MPTPSESFSAISATLEKDILDIIPYQRYQRAPIYKMFGGYEPINDQQDIYRENTSISVGTRGTSMQNNNLYFDIITGQTGGAGAMSTALQVGYGSVPLAQGIVPLTRQYAAFTIGEDVLLTPGVVKDTFALSIEQGINSSAMDMSRQLYSDGTALIGTANATQSTPSTTFVFAASTNGDIDYAEFVPGTPYGGTLLQIGTNQPVQVVGTTAVNTVTLSSPITWTAGNSVYKVTPDGVQANVENVGLNAIIATGAYAGITDPSWVAAKVTNSFGSFSANGGGAAMNNTWIKASRNGNPSNIFMNMTLFGAYGNGLTSLKQFNYNDPLYAGWPTLEFMGTNGTVVLDPYAPDASIYFLSPKTMWMAYLEQIHWLPGTQGVLNRIPGSANFEAVATMYEAAFCNVRSANAIINGVTP